jgi:predicted phage terminase large subunit-like protein
MIDARALISQKMRVNKAVRDTDYFARTYLDMPLYENQKEWDKFFNEHDKALLEAPVGHAKSHLVAFIKLLQVICADRNVRILYGTETATLAEDNIRRIAHQLRYNIRLIEDFGGFYRRTNKWSGSHIEVIRSEKMFKEPTLTGVGMLGAIEGSRFTLGVLDDPIDIKSMRSAAERRAAKDWLDNTFIPRLEPEARVWVIGSAWHQDDLYVHIAKKPSFESKTYVAIIDDIKKTVLCPERWSYDKLISRKRDIGSSAYNLRFQNNRKAREGTTFKRDWLRYYESIDRAFLRVFQGWDLAIGEEIDDPCYTACATIGVSKLQDVYLLDMFRKMIDFPEQVRMVKLLGTLWNPLKIGIESNAYQKALAQHSRSMDLTLAGKVKDVPTVKDKLIRMDSMSVHFENGKVYIKRGMEEFEDEYLAFPYGKYVDQLDALEIALSLAKGGRRVRRFSLK